LYGGLTAHTAEGALSAGMPETEIIRADSHVMIVIDILARAEAGDFVLVKGSRGMQMDRVAEGIRNRSL
jgi:UDP-N-acetylmuramoyl-tripeptide--D-alanyl-D-alanine ligase